MSYKTKDKGIIEFGGVIDAISANINIIIAFIPRANRFI